MALEMRLFSQVLPDVSQVSMLTLMAPTSFFSQVTLEITAGA